MPDSYGPWSTLYDRFRMWSRDAVLETVMDAGGRPVSHDATLCKVRNTVERAINKFKEWRGPATRYDKTPGSYAAGLHLRGSILW
ncbi:hypothetical protein [Streptomyces indiaensis]|uniref:Transposase of IS4/5 family DUF4096 n=1 Tax=Streptomyces indiaensis TaxID=284033 RepID=A0ABP5Q170_9ACTN